jgi:pimeloyl-ACP methyl ester carboxylesterase
MRKQLMLIGLRAVLRLLGTLAPERAATLAFHLFRLPSGRSRLRETELPTMRRATVETLTIRTLQVQTYRWGNGARPVLMLHGWESRGARFAPLVERLLDEGYSPICFDSPGHGESEGEGATILDYLAISEALHERHGDFEAIVGHSFGVLCGFIALAEGVHARCAVAVSGVSEFHYLFDAFSAELRLSDALKRALRTRIEGFFDPLDDIWARFSVTRGTPDLQQPVLLIHDEDDRMVSPGQALRTAAHFGTQAELMLTAGLGHNRILCDGMVIDRISGFIRRKTETPALRVVPAGIGA